VLFVTNGGQNSLMESMSAGTPVVVCPGFGDQLANAAKVQARGWGVKVSEPRPALSADASTGTSNSSSSSAEDPIASYQEAVQAAVRVVLRNKHFAATAERIASSLQNAAGVDGALRILLKVAGRA
jgi:UDP:flavonoid glycosyltransferase YjiC (YdhE family)